MKPDNDYNSARRYAKRDQQERWNEAPDGLSRWVVYNQLPAVAVDNNATPTTETCRQADLLFDRIKDAEAFKNMKEQDKRVHWHKLYHALKHSIHKNGCVRYSRRRHDKEACSHTFLQVVECGVESGLVNEIRSPSGSPKMSRLLASQEIRAQTEIDPWEFDPQGSGQYVFVRDRATKNELAYAPANPVAARYQKRLAKINEVNGSFDIYCRPYCEWDEAFESRRQLRPVHYAIFTDTFEKHGRIYTGRYGHQSLRKVERATIEFEMEPHVMEPSVELDYGSYHTRMAYHLAGMDYRDDPYELWDETTKPMRLIAKTLINAAFSAKDAQATISTCNLARYPKTKNGDWKDGKARDTALLLDRACRKTGLSFKDVYELALKKHSRIANRFGSDAGMQFMRIDSEIALNVMYHFAKQGLPCLGVHDSFIVPRTCKSELLRVMKAKYRNKLGFLPIIK